MIAVEEGKVDGGGSEIEDGTKSRLDLIDGRRGNTSAAAWYARPIRKVGLW